MRPRYPVEVVLKDPKARDDTGRPVLVFITLASDEDLASLEREVESGRYVVLNALSPSALVEDIARSRRKRRRKSSPDSAPPMPEDDYEDVIDDDEDEEEDDDAAARPRAGGTNPGHGPAETPTA